MPSLCLLYDSSHLQDLGHPGSHTQSIAREFANFICPCNGVHACAHLVHARCEHARARYASMHNQAHAHVRPCQLGMFVIHLAHAHCPLWPGLPRPSCANTHAGHAKQAIHPCTCAPMHNRLHAHACLNAAYAFYALACHVRAQVIMEAMWVRQGV